MSANTDTTGGPPKGYVECPKKCGRWTNDVGECWTCRGRADWSPHSRFPDWTPPIAAPAAHVERRKGQRWRSERRLAPGILVVTGTLGERLDSGNGWRLSNVERSDGIGAFDSCFVDSLWSNPSETMTLLADATPEPVCAKDVFGEIPPGSKLTNDTPVKFASAPTAQEAPKFGWQSVARCGLLCICGGPTEYAARVKSEALLIAHERDCSQCIAKAVHEAPKYLEERARCGYVVMSTNREAAITEVGKHQAGCLKCRAQEAPKAAPVCGNNGCKTPTQNVAQRWCASTDGYPAELEWSCEPCHLLDEKDFTMPTKHAPYAGPERLPRPQLAADWVEDCLEDVR